MTNYYSLVLQGQFLDVSIESWRCTAQEMTNSAWELQEKQKRRTGLKSQQSIQPFSCLALRQCEAWRNHTHTQKIQYVTTLVFPHLSWLLEEMETPTGLLGFPDSSVGKECACNAGDPCLTPELGRSPGAGKGYPLQCSGLENSMDCIVHGVTERRTGLSNFHFHGYQRGAVGAEKLVVWD